VKLTNNIGSVYSHRR